MTDTAGERPAQHDARSGVTRREIISGAVAFGAGVGLDRAIGAGGGGTERVLARAEGPSAHAVPFYGANQAGVATPAQEYLSFASFDLTAQTRADLRALLVAWTHAAAQLTAGEPFSPPGAATSAAPAAASAPQDTGEATGLPPAALTLTFGLGPGVFSSPRLGLAAQASSELHVLPPFSGERLQAARSGGDLCVQACANDPQVAFHAVHVLRRIAAGRARLRWMQLGFGRTSATSRNQETLRNLMGFKDGTENIRGEETAAMERTVWVGAGDGPPWMVGGTYLVARRISILFDTWDATSLREQERTIGRHKHSGAPLGARREADPLDLGRRGPDGEPVIPNDAHVRIASPASNEGQRILRRGYSFSEAAHGPDGELDAGLFFIAFQRSIQRQFVPLQSHLAGFDALNRFTLHTASAVFACPPGARPGGYVGEQLLG
ncbi:MAG TPA: iron uptake transporter deferrochelatase/peroxidase subunit [Solirubrobacteraceae bacterium]|jgi:deferrochelatase/peroxidase EfeB|nr:iron uptake transporter deferrochelatase/peroxidase subunit [Solirubrobacteraceae bacterium]